MIRKSLPSGFDPMGGNPVFRKDHAPPESKSANRFNLKRLRSWLHRWPILTTCAAESFSTRTRLQTASVVWVQVDRAGRLSHPFRDRGHAADTSGSRLEYALYLLSGQRQVRHPIAFALKHFKVEASQAFESLRARHPFFPNWLGPVSRRRPFADGQPIASVRDLAPRSDDSEAFSRREMRRWLGAATREVDRTQLSSHAPDKRRPLPRHSRSLVRALPFVRSGFKFSGRHVHKPGVRADPAAAGKIAPQFR
jgi:hypothetical protein